MVYQKKAKLIHKTYEKMKKSLIYLVILLIISSVELALIKDNFRANDDSTVETTVNEFTRMTTDNETSNENNTVYSESSTVETTTLMPTSTVRPTFSPGTRFADVCTQMTKNELLFDGSCQLYPTDVFNDTLTYYLDIIQKSDSEKSIDKLIREDFFKDSTIFFRANFSKTNPEYINALDDFEVRLNKLAGILQNGLKDTTILDFVNEYIDSGMSSVSTKIIKARDQIIDSSSEEDFPILNKELNCLYGSGFCKRSEEMFGLILTSEWRPLTLEKALTKALDNSYDFLKKTGTSLTLFADKEVFENFFKDLSDKGTSKMYVKDLLKVTETNMFRLIVIGFDALRDFTPITKPTTTIIELNTTEPVPIIYGKAVSNAVAYGVPAGIVGIGIIFSIIFIILTVFKKPTVNVTDCPGIEELEGKNIPLKRI